MVDDKAIYLIKEYMKNYLSLTPNCLKESWLSERFYARWAAEEILLCAMNKYLDVPSYITGKLDNDIYEIIDDFTQEMKCLLSIKETKIFTIAIDTAKSIKRFLKKNGY